VCGAQLVARVHPATLAAQPFPVQKPCACKLKGDAAPGEPLERLSVETEKAYPNLIHYNELDRGGHFAAWEQPELYASEIRDGFRSLR